MLNQNSIFRWEPRNLGIWLAFLMLPIARSHWQFQWLAIVAKPVLIIVVIASFALLLKQSSHRVRAVSIWLGASTMSVVLEWVLRQLNTGEPIELLLLELLWCAGIACQFGGGTFSTRTADSIAIFLAAFVFFINPTWPVAFAGGFFAMAMVFQWLQGYWRQIQSEFVDATLVERTGSHLLMPTLVTFVLIAILTASLRIPAVAKLSSRFSPFSGGETWADPFAMSGIGDGETLIAATKTAQTEGPVDSDIFIESKKRSLYDIVNDLYGDAKKPKANQEINSAVSLTSEKMQKNHKRLASAEMNSATFSLTRDAKGKREIPNDLKSDVLLLVEKQGPLGLKMQTFDQFDGQQWSQKPPTRQTFYDLSGSATNDWYCLKRPARSKVLRSFDRLAVSFVHLESQHVPTPPLLEAWSIPQVNRRDFYSVAADQLTMNIGNSVPQFTRVSILNRGFRLPDRVETSHLVNTGTEFCLNPAETIKSSDLGFTEGDAGRKYLQKCADRLIAKHDTGSWRRVEEIIQFLRTNFRHTGHLATHYEQDSLFGGSDQEVRSESLTPTEFPLSRFVEAGGGEDFHFATAAAVMLNHAGFQTRLVQGFYVRPDSLDPRTGKSSVVATDLHTWLEIQVQSNVWVPLEPTPGYLPIPEARSWADHATDGLAAGVSWVLSHPLTSFMASVCFLTIWSYRKSIQGGFRWLQWRVLLALDPGNSIKWTLQWTFRVCSEGQCRQLHEPVGTWIHRLAVELGLSGDLKSQFIQTVNQQLYGGRPQLSYAQCKEICLAWVRDFKGSQRKQRKAKESRKYQDRWEISP